MSGVPAARDQLTDTTLGEQLGRAAALGGGGCEADACTDSPLPPHHSSFTRFTQPPVLPPCPCTRLCPCQVRVCVCRTCVCTCKESEWEKMKVSDPLPCLHQRAGCQQQDASGSLVFSFGSSLAWRVTFVLGEATSALEHVSRSRSLERKRFVGRGEEFLSAR